jgi:hypothetical protein
VAHLTSTGNETGIYLWEDGVATGELYNSIAWNNSVADWDPHGAVEAADNLFGSNPLFEDPGNGDCRLGAGSPAVDTGDATHPGTQFKDLDHAPRVVGSDTDKGAYERGGIFADDLESGDLSAWSASN